MSAPVNPQRPLGEWVVCQVPAAHVRQIHLDETKEDLKVLARALSDSPKTILAYAFTRFTEPRGGGKRLGVELEANVVAREICISHFQT
jgi:hypothetical protein